MSDFVGQVTVGILAPSETELSGGSFRLQSTLYSEILKRLKIQSSADPVLLTLLSDSRITKTRNSPSTLYLHKRSVFSSLYHKASSMLNRPTLGREHLYTSSSINYVGRNIDLVWSLDPFTITTSFPFCVTVYDLQHRLQPHFPEVSTNREWFLRNSYYSKVVRRAFSSVVGTQRGKDELSLFYGIHPDRILVNPFPCPTPVQSKDVDQKLFDNLNLQPFTYIFYPAQFWSHKNHLILIESIQSLVSAGINFKLVFTGSDKGCLKALEYTIQKLDLSNSIINLGFVSTGLLALLYKNAFCLAYPSFFGPDNLPPLEAMSYSCPCVVSDVPGAREQFGSSALYFNPDDSQSFVAKLTELYHNPNLRTELIRNGYDRIATLSPSAYIDRFFNHISSHKMQLSCASLERS